MKATILITLTALLGSSVAMTMSRAEPRPMLPNKPAKFDPSKYDHIVAEVRPLGVKPSLVAVEVAPHHPEQQNQHIEVDIKQQQPQHVEQAEKPHHFDLNVHSAHHQPHHGLNFEVQHHRPEHNLIDAEFHHQQQQQQPPQRVELEITHIQQQQQPQQVDLEIRQVDRNPQQVHVNVHGSHHGHEQQLHHGLEFEPHHVELEFEPIEPKPHHIEVELVHPQNY
ncbi:hypothetical protein ACLKA7_014632 [Drosophila subpalustris]